MRFRVLVFTDYDGQVKLRSIPIDRLKCQPQKTEHCYAQPKPKRNHDTQR